MNLIIASATYVGETCTDSGLRFLNLSIPAKGNNPAIPLSVVPNKAAGDSFDVFTPGCHLLVSGRMYPNRNDYKMYVVPTQALQLISKDVSINQVNLAGGIGYIAEQKLEDLFSFSLMCKAPSQQLLGHNWQDSMGFRMEAWGDDAKRLSTLLYVGRQVAMAGSLRYNTWKAQDGSQRATYQVRVRAGQYSVFGKNQPKDGVESPQKGVDTKAAACSMPPLQQAPVGIGGATWESSEQEADEIPF
jgi:single-stranded DNA-binding protein